MKKIFLIIASISILSCCTKNDDDINFETTKTYLPTILTGDDLVITLTFDNHSNIIQLGELANNGEFARLYTFYYEEDKLTSADAIYFSTAIEGGYNYSEKFNFEYKGDKIMLKKVFLDNHGYTTTTNEVLLIDENKNLIETNGLKLKYDQIGNLIEINENNNITRIEYDNKKGAFLNVKTEPWALYYIMKLGIYYKKNNPVKIMSFREDANMEDNAQITIERNFEYNKDSFPIKYSENKTDENGTVTNEDYFIDYLRLYME